MPNQPYTLRDLMELWVETVEFLRGVGFSEMKAKQWADRSLRVGVEMAVEYEQHPEQFQHPKT